MPIVGLVPFHTSGIAASATAAAVQPIIVPAFTEALGQAWWLVDLAIDGVVYRYAHADLEVLAQSGDVLHYRAGLGDIDALSRGQLEVDLEVLDSGVDWPALASRLQTVEVRRWLEGQLFEQSVVYTSGQIRDLEHGTRDELVTFTARTADIRSGRGVRIPDSLAFVTRDSWPFAMDLGRSYPIVFGYPGDDGGPGIPVVPVPVVVHSGSGISVLVSHDVLELSNLLIQDDGAASTLVTSVGAGADLLGRIVTVATLDSAHPLYLPSNTSSHRLRVSFAPSIGGGVATTAWEAIEYLLQRFGRDSVDWPRMRGVADDLAQYRVDTWIEEPVDSPWSWIEALVEYLPFEILRGDSGGRYLRRLRWQPTGNPATSFEVGADAVRVGGRLRVEGDRNEFLVQYRPGTSAGEWHARTVVTSAGGVKGAVPGVSTPGNDAIEPARVVVDDRCTSSFTRWGVGQADLLSLDWTWDPSTALAVIDWRIERDGVDAWESTYAVLRAHDLEVGDEVLITDEDFELVDQIAVVVAPVAADRTDYAIVTVRYPSS